MAIDAQNIPENWTQPILEKVCEILDSKRIPVNNNERSQRIEGKSDNELYPYYGATGQVGVIDDYIFEDESILLGEDGAPFLDPFKEKAYLVNGKYWVNNHAHILKSYTNNKYLCHFLNQIDYSGHVTGTTRLKLTQGALKQIPVNFAPELEQLRIVSKIEELFSELDKGVESLKTAREQLKAYRQAALKHAFQGKLTEQWRNENNNDIEASARLLTHIKCERKDIYRFQFQKWKTGLRKWEESGQRGRKPKKPIKPKVLDPITEKELENLPSLPSGWLWVRLGDIGLVGTGVTPLKSNSKYYSGGDVPWVTSGALNDSFVRHVPSHVTEAALNNTNLRVYPLNTLVVALYGEGKTRGKCSELLIEATTNQAIAAIVQEGKSSGLRGLIKWFLTMNYESIRLGSSGGVQPNLNLGIIENLAVPICSIAEAKEIEKEIESRLSEIESLDIELSSLLQRCDALRHSILKKAFSGQLVKQDPNDEPASILLERIRAEKTEQEKTHRKNNRRKLEKSLI